MKISGMFLDFSLFEELIKWVELNVVNENKQNRKKTFFIVLFIYCTMFSSKCVKISREIKIKIFKGVIQNI